MRSIKLKPDEANLVQRRGVETLSPMIAWKIDDKQAKFVTLQTKGLRCSRDGIITADWTLNRQLYISLTTFRIDSSK